MGRPRYRIFANISLQHPKSTRLYAEAAKFSECRSVVLSLIHISHVGDTVLVESDSAPVIGLAAIMYLLPMVLLVLGYVMGQLLHLSELGSIGTAALAFALSVGILILVDRRLKRSRSMTFRIIQIKGA